MNHIEDSLKTVSWEIRGSRGNPLFSRFFLATKSGGGDNEVGVDISLGKQEAA
jgi:hypothetical protein